MKQDNLVFPFIGFIVAIIPYIFLIAIINDEILKNILTIVGLITAFINAFIFYKKTKYLN